MRRPSPLRFAVALALCCVAPSIARASSDKIVIGPSPTPTTEFAHCEEIIQNTTSTTKTITVTICNLSENLMDVDVSGTKKATIRGLQCRTLIIELGPGEFLHADQDGTIAYVVTPAPQAKQP